MALDSVGLLHDFARLARMLAKHSPCKRRGVACVVFDPGTMQIVGWGCNEPARGRICSGEKDNCGCLHSEVNTILNCKHVHTLDNAMIASRAPCVPCASVIANCGFIGTVYVLDESEPGAAGIAVLRLCGIAVEWLKIPDTEEAKAEIGLRDPSMKPSEPGSLDEVAIKHKIAVLKERYKALHVSTSNDDAEYNRMEREIRELEKQLKQIS